MMAAAKGNPTVTQAVIAKSFDDTILARLGISVSLGQDSQIILVVVG
jgi:hypothetical protein